jgi:D-hexose-6-phosphate mutarotase
MRELTLMLVLAAAAAAQTVTLANHQIKLSVAERGGALVNLVLLDDAEKLSPLWNPAAPAGRAGDGAAGHFICVDGFGPGSAEERAAGLPGHGEAHLQLWQIDRSAKDGTTGVIAFHAHLPLVQENLTRTLRLVDGENVIYVERALESEVGFDRPISWAEHTTVGSPFLQSGVTLSSISGSRAQNRPYQGMGGNGMNRRLALGPELHLAAGAGTRRQID